MDFSMQDQPTFIPVGSEWKATIEANFGHWLEQLDADPALAAPKAAQTPDTPDLYAFYEQLCSLRTEVRRGTRRSQDVLSGFGETLAEFDRMVRTVNDRLAAAANPASGDDAQERAFRLAVVELFERFKRISSRLATPPKTGWLAQRRWQTSWASLREGFSILQDHFQDLLNHQGIVLLSCLGRPFDPHTMKAVAFTHDSSSAPDTVVEELSGGYLYKDQVLRYAEVKIAVEKGNGT
jgi:molecular chaperone GrpE